MNEGPTSPFNFFLLIVKVEFPRDSKRGLVHLMDHQL